jgi:hypothetical protein
MNPNYFVMTSLNRINQNKEMINSTAINQYPILELI